MRKRARRPAAAGGILLLCLALAGCGADGLMDQIPRDFALTMDSREVGQSSAYAENNSDGEPAAEILRESFLAEDANEFALRTLGPAEAVWYRDIEKALGCFGERAELSPEGFEAGLDEESVDKIFQCVLIDHPELFYVDGYSYLFYEQTDPRLSRKNTAGAEASSAGQGGGTRLPMRIEFSGTYTMDYETALERKREIEEAVEKLLSGISPDASEYEKTKYVYEAVAMSTDYELDAPDSQNIYSVFVNHSSVCQGYAKAAQYLLNRLGMECTLVMGTVFTGERHAWNLVKVDGSYYYMDATWGDAFYQMEDQEAGYAQNMPQIDYDYLNITTSELLRTHTPDRDVPMPECVAVEANYYVREGALFSSCDRERLRELFDRAAAEGRTDVTVKCADETCFEEIFSALVEEREIFDYMEPMGESIAYSENRKLLSLTFWVTNE